MAAKTGRNNKRKPEKTENTQIWLFLGILFFIAISVSIYFKSQSGFLGDILGGFLFQLFGIFAYGVPVLILLLTLSTWLHLWGRKIGGIIAYLTGLYFCAMLVVWAKVSPKGSFKTSMQMAGEWGRKIVGPGQFGGFFGYGMMNFIGQIGIICLTVLVLFFFILYLLNWTLADFFKLLSSFFHGIGTSFANLFHRFKDLHDDLDLPEIDTSIKNEEIEDPPLFAEDEGEEKNAFTKDTDRLPLSEVKEKLEEKKEKTETMTMDPPMERGKTARPAIPINDYAAKTQLLAEQISEEAAFSENANKDSFAEDFDSSDSILSSEVLKQDTHQPKEENESNIAEQEKGKEEESGQKEAQESIKPEEKPYVIPPLNLLNPAQSSSKVDSALLKKQARDIEKTLESFGIESEVVSIRRGPTVTLFELKPQAGIKVSKITNLSDDLAMALSAPVVRIEAPIPGKPYVGIEVPNPVADSVSFRQLLQTGAFQETERQIPVALGQSIEGETVIAKMAKMPHLLIAGATGSGKSVCINTIIMSVLYKYSPKDLRMILIDPKVVELSVYNGIPHLLIPVVTDPKKASQALYMAVQEMERRFRLFSKTSSRDIASYHEKQKVDDTLENLPLMLVIIDELSDLMMVASKDVEAHITRLAQMARACGIHLIIATQRPSVDVITGTIKANIPSRISFQVSSSTDSRTILDQGGAEKLLGKGDMLYYPASYPKPVRVQGAFISDGEVEKVVDFVKETSSTNYDKKFIQSMEETHDSSASGSAEDSDHDELMDEVLEFISHEETTSISGLQRRFRIGYSRAGRIIDDLEAMGAVSAQDGSKPRQVLVKADELGKENQDGQDEPAQ